MMQTELLSTHTTALFAAAVERAAGLLRRGEIVALPTETVYGLAANAFDPAAVRRIYEAKGRPPHNPIIVHVASLAMARRCVATWTRQEDQLAAAFWPGPLTFVLRRSRNIPNIVTAGGDTVGVRWPAHPLMQSVIQACEFPLAAPSANLSGALSPTNAAHVMSRLGGRIPLVVDGGQSQVGIESTVLDLATNPPRILRPGIIHQESLAAVVGEVQGLEGRGAVETALRSPGQLPKHYAPRAKLVVLSWRNETDLKSQISSLAVESLSTQIIAHTQVPLGGAFGGVSVIPHDAEAFARALYAELHRCDAQDPSLIIVEAPPREPAWRAISDRLTRASAT
jgi:L-threonylcarbamoyladenylate synthase